MTSLPYMQLYTSDYLADTAHLTTVEHGAYLLLLMNYWQRGKPLDNTDGRLAHVARLSAEEWKAVEPILAEFFTIQDNIWTQARIERDLDKIRQKSSKLAANGSIGGSKKQANAKQMPIYEEEEEDEEEDEDEDNKNTIDSLFDIFWNKYPRKTAKGAARKAWLVAKKKASYDKIIIAAANYADDPNRDPAFTAHASTWLNQERWLDGPLPPRKWSPEEIKAQELARAKERDQKQREEAQRLILEEEQNRARAVPMPEDLRKLIGVARGTQ